MLDDKDIQKLIEVFATREEVATKKELKELRKGFARLETFVNTYSKRANPYFQEMVALSHKVDRHEKWIKQIAEKTGLKLEY